MSQRTTQTRTAKYTSDDRRAAAYDILKALAEQENVPLPTARNQGVEFDEWLKNKLAAIEAAKEGKR